MKTLCTTLTLCGLSGMAFGDVVMDQIGPDDGSGIGTNITGCQDFEAAYDIYDIATMDNFAGAGENITMVEMVLNGWNGFVDPSSVSGYTANLHSDPSVAALDLIGDIGSSYADAADATVSATWAGDGYVVAMPSEMAAAAGTNWVSMVPSNDFATGGQTGVADTINGDGILGWQANPGGGFGMPGNMQEMTGEAAYRLYAGGAADPCDSALGDCPADVNGDGPVTTDDLLIIIGNFGSVGDGTFRPEGDIAPLPNGDCAVNVDDILMIMAEFGSDCTPAGACCFDDGTCHVKTLADCDTYGGTYQGDDTLCEDIVCGMAYSGCPDGADSNCDACWVDGDDSSSDCNAGLNGNGAMDTLTLAVPMCGEASVYFDPNVDNGDGTFGATLRDTDWFTCVGLNEGGSFSITCEAETGTLIFGIVDLDSSAFVEYIAVDPGQVVTHDYAAFAPGNYAFWVGPSDWNVDWSCANGANYWLTLEAGDPAMGVCCVGATCAGQNTLADCDALGGAWTFGATCTDVYDCQPVIGACCMSEIDCVDDFFESDCTAFGGTFAGIGTVCAGMDCTPSAYDQIGAANGSDVGGNTTASQMFETAYEAYNIATLDNFTFDATSHVSAIEAVISGWNGYGGITPITNYTISVYSSPDAAGADLVGDVYSIDIVTPNLPAWTGAGDLVSFDIDVTLPAGEYYFAVIPWNDFGVNGQTGISDYTGGATGDGVYWQANPNGGFGFGPFQQGAGDSAYRLTVD